MSISAKSNRFVVACGRIFNLYQLDNFNLIETTEGSKTTTHTANISSVTFNSLGTKFITGSYDNSIILWDANKG